MKKTGVYMWAAIMNVFMKYYNTKDLADKVVELASKNDKELQISEVRRTSMVFKHRRDCGITENELNKLLSKSVRKLIEEEKNSIQADITDRYEFEYDEKVVDDDFADEIFTITKGPKNVYVEIDLG